MIFTSLLYPLFLVVAVIGFHLLPKRLRPLYITICGSVFYGLYAGGFLLLVVVEAVLVYLLAKHSVRSASIYVLALSGVIGILAVYKYRLMIYSLVAAPLHLQPIGAMHIAIPLALSFYTFEFIHYLADVRQGKSQPHGFFEFMAFTMFFPTMVAGPIKRFQDFIPKLNAATLAWNLIGIGLFRIAIGVVKKVVIADSMNLWVTPLTSGSSELSAGLVAGSLVAYSIKIYMDFSGYSDIAIGSAALFGIVVPENFSFPYLKTNIAAFWKSWHMSLTRWIIDYIFIPLGGSRSGLVLASVNTLIALGISGLWHGAALNFFAWGLYHGALLVFYRLYRTFIKPRVLLPAYTKPVTNIAAGSLTFALVTLGWGFFIMPAGRYVDILSRLIMGA